MHSIDIDISALGPGWTRPARAAIDDLNKRFKQGGIQVKLVATSSKTKKATIKVSIDPSIGKTMVHGKTRTVVTGAGKLLEAQIGLPSDVLVSVPKGPRSAGAGLREVIVAHEIVHALMHAKHTSHLMAQTMRVSAGDAPNGDKLEADGVAMPPIRLAPASVTTLKQLWK